MNKKQAELIGVFNGLPAPIVNTYFLDKFRNIYTTIGESLKLDEVINEFAELSIIPRGTKTPTLSVNGFNRTTITPDILGGKSELSTNELVSLQAGQSETVINGNIVNNYEDLRDRHLNKLKRAYTITASKMAAELYLTGKLNLPVSKDVIDFGYVKPVDKKVKKADMDWALFLLDLINEYEKDNGIYPTTIEVDMNIFKAMMNDATFRDQIKTFNHTQLGNSVNITPEFTIWQYKVKALPNSTDTAGNKIDISNLIYLSDDSEFAKAYTGIAYNNNGKLDIFKGEYIVNEITESDPASQYFILQSGFCPIIPIAKRVKRYKLTLND